MFSNKKVALAALCITLFGASTAYAQSQMAPSFDDQLALDVTPVPPGSGAIFVPSLSNPKYESHVAVYYQGQKIASGRTGERLIVPPGEYEVRIANGNKDLAAHSMARVVDGATVVMQPFYGAVRLTAIDENNNPLSVDFDIKQSGAIVADGSTPVSDEEKARTYLLPPGPKTWKFDDGTEIAFDVPVGQFTNYRATFQNNQFVGLSHSDSPLEKKTVKKSMWRARLTIGADVSGGYAEDQNFSFNGYYGMIGGFANAEVGLDYGDHLATLKLNLDESWLVFHSEANEETSLPLTPLRDKAGLELLYAYRWYRILGPFARVNADTSIFGGLRADETCSQGKLISKKAKSILKGNCRKTGFGRPLYIEEAVGLSVTAIDNRTFDLVLLGGLAARQNIFKFNKNDKSYYQKDDPSGKVRVWEEFTEKSQMFYGAMAEARLGLRVGRTFRLSLNGKMFVPYQQIPGINGLAPEDKNNPTKDENKKKFNPIFTATGLAQIAITNWASFVIRGEYAVPFIVLDAKGKNEIKPNIYGGAALRFQTSFF